MNSKKILFFGFIAVTVFTLVLTPFVSADDALSAKPPIFPPEQALHSTFGRTLSSEEVITLDESFIIYGTAWKPQPPVYVSSTPDIFYYVSFNHAAVGDKIHWEYYRPVLDPQTYLPTGEFTYRAQGTWTRTTETYWEYTTGITGYMRYDWPYAGGDFNCGVEVKPNPESSFVNASSHPGLWKVTVSHNGTILITDYFAVIDDLPPAVSILSPADGT